MKFFAILFCAALAVAPIHAGPSEDLAALKKLEGRNAINVLRVAAAVQDGETVTLAGVVFEVDTTLVSGITTGNTRLDLHGGTTAAAVGTLTSDNSNVTAADTVTIGAVTYTFRASVTTTANEVKIGADADTTLLNLIKAINLSGTGGTEYGSLTVIHPTVSAATSVTSHAFVVTAKIPGTVGNAIASTEASTHLSFGGATLASGLDPTAGEFTTSLQAAIAATNVLGFTFTSTRVSANEILVVRNAADVYTGACTETLAGSNNAWASSTFYGGAAVPAQLKVSSDQQRAALAVEVGTGNAHFLFPFTPTAAVVQVRSTAGATKAWDGAVTITGSRVTVDNSGSTDWIAGDLITVTAAN